MRRAGSQLLRKRQSIYLVGLVSLLCVVLYLNVSTVRSVTNRSIAADEYGSKKSELASDTRKTASTEQTNKVQDEGEQVDSTDPKLLADLAHTTEAFLNSKIQTFKQACATWKVAAVKQLIQIKPGVLSSQVEAHVPLPGQGGTATVMFKAQFQRVSGAQDTWDVKRCTPNGMSHYSPKGKCHAVPASIRPYCSCQAILKAVKVLDSSGDDPKRDKDVIHDAAFQNVPAKVGESCTEACSAQNMPCEDNAAEIDSHIQQCGFMVREFSCPNGCDYGMGHDFPALQTDTPLEDGTVHPKAGVCILNAYPEKYGFQCDAKNPSIQRLCLCRMPEEYVEHRLEEDKADRPSVEKIVGYIDVQHDIEDAMSAPKLESNDHVDTQLQEIWSNHVVNVALGVHISPDKVPAAKELANRWRGPLILAVYSEPTHTLKTSFPENVKVVFVQPKKDDAMYPVNDLRQAALEACPDHWFFLALDVDFMPSAGLYDSMKRRLPWLKSVATTGVIVIPAFEADEGQPAPSNMEELQQCRDSKKCRGVLEEKYEWAHRRTDLAKWKDATEPYEIEYEWTFEPYIAGLRHCLPSYHKDFKYYGNDKIQWVYHTAVWGPRFFVFPEEFVTHKHHTPNNWSGPERDQYKEHIRVRFNTFKEEIKSDQPPKGCFKQIQNQVW